MAYKGIEYLRRRLAQKSERVRLRYKYYEAKNLLIDRSPLTPPSYRNMQAVLGWCAKATDSLADRLVFSRFDNDLLDMDPIYAMNNRDVLFDSAILSALISACCFIYISADDDGYPTLQVIDGARATGLIDPITNMLTEGYAILAVDDKGRPTQEAYFTAEETVIYTQDADLVAGFDPGLTVDAVVMPGPSGTGVSARAVHIPNPAPYPLLVPIIYRPDAARPFGHSRISRACMSITQSALRTIKRSEISADFYSFPQKYVLGLSEDAQDDFDKVKASLSSFLSFGRDEDGQMPSVGQFTQQSMSPYTEQLRTFAALFSGETGLTLDDLGFATENPSSAEAIKACHESLRLTARKAQRTFGTGFANAGYLAACVRDNFKYSRRQLSEIVPVWEPIFETDFASLGLVGDGVSKINTAVPGYFNRDNLRQLTGIAPSDLPAPVTEEA